MIRAEHRALRDAFGAFITGVTVVTTLDRAQSPLGFTANSFASVSLDPALLLVCIAKTSANLASFVSSNGFAVNVLAETQKDVSRVFASPVDNRFDCVGWRLGPHGSPLLDGVAAWFDCSTRDTVDAGDHVILIGHVEAFANAGFNGLGYAQGSYFTPSVQERAVAAAAGEGGVVLGAIIERAGTVLLVPDDDGRLSLPSASLTPRADAGTDLDRLLAELGIGGSHGFIYSVYEDTRSRVQHIVYRCAAGDGAPRRGAFHPIEALPYSSLVNAATASMLKRFADESRLGNFGIYFGDHQAGRVRRPSQET